MVIVEKSQELGRLIGQSEEYKALKRAETRLSEEPQLRAQLERLRDLAQSIEQGVAQGGEPSSADAASYNELLTSVQSDAAYQGVVVAQSNFDKLMIKANQQIAEGIAKGAASPIITLG